MNSRKTILCLWQVRKQVKPIEQIYKKNEKENKDTREKISEEMSEVFSKYFIIVNISHTLVNNDLNINKTVECKEKYFGILWFLI